MNKLAGATALLLLASFADVARADVFSIGGRISQSVEDGTGPAANNPSLNNILDGDLWNASLAFDGSLAAGTPTTLSNASLSFLDPASGAVGSGFGFLSLTITDVGGVDQFSLFACLTTGSGCAVGNQLTASFQIPDANLHSGNVATTGLDEPHPLDLLEDDGTTDIQGSITDYSYTSSAAPVPEPSALTLLGTALMLLSVGTRKRLHFKTIFQHRRNG